MNEDDTFNALKRTPFKKVQSAMQEDVHDFSTSILGPFDEYETEFINRHGYSIIEFQRAWAENALEENPGIVSSLFWKKLDEIIK